ncbi:MAG: sigma-70 family RNA polymerase sigma factor [Lachnospiraceae bacterium]|nr:sigma-70 family RNA polymerase sigma factor [Lachnospiraceae bacterium]
MDVEKIYLEYHDKIFRYVREKVGLKEDAEDICSDIFLKLQKKLPEYNSNKAAMSTWVYTIARNTVIDFYRTRHDTDELSDELAGELASEYDTDSEIMDRETLSELAAALRKLTDEERAVIVLHYYDGLSLADIEKRTGLSYGQVKLRHNSGLKSMKKFLSDKPAKKGFHIVKT